MPGFKVDSMGEIVFCSVENVSVMDVYDLAMDIGKECESLITVVGSDSANSLIKKVIVALELLERFANKNDQENSALAEMACRIEQLEAEKEKKAESRHKFEKVGDAGLCRCGYLTNWELCRRWRRSRTSGGMSPGSCWSW